MVNDSPVTLTFEFAIQEKAQPVADAVKGIVKAFPLQIDRVFELVIVGFGITVIFICCTIPAHPAFEGVAEYVTTWFPVLVLTSVFDHLEED